MIRAVWLAALLAALALGAAGCAKSAATDSGSSSVQATPDAASSQTPLSDESPASAALPQTAAPEASDSAAPVATGSMAAAGAAPSVSTSASAPAGKTFTDLGGVFGASQIVAVARLGTFDSIASTTFSPNAPVLRREFVRWLYTANNALQGADPSKQVHPAPGGENPYFSDLPASDADFAPIQGMQDAGISVGFPDKTFKPDLPISREQALAVAAALNCAYSGVWSTTPNEAYAYLPAWKDRAQVSKTYAPILAGCAPAVSEIAGRAFGKVATIRPQAPVLRSEAALMLFKINNVSAAQAQAAPAATSTP